MKVFYWPFVALLLASGLAWMVKASSPPAACEAKCKTSAVPAPSEGIAKTADGPVDAEPALPLDVPACKVEIGLAERDLVERPAAACGPCLTCEDHACQDCVATRSVLHAGREELLQMMLETLLENERLKARSELAKARHEMLEQLLEVIVEKSKLEARLELAEQKVQLAGELLKAKAESAAQVARLEVIEQQQELLGELFESRLEQAEESLELAAQAGRAELQEAVLGALHEENCALKDRVAELQNSLNARDSRTVQAARPRTARKAKPADTVE
jgi:hypothetical protein